MISWPGTELELVVETCTKTAMVQLQKKASRKVTMADETDDFWVGMSSVSACDIDWWPDVAKSGWL
jgi:hypothetical protein